MTYTNVHAFAYKIIKKMTVTAIRQNDNITLNICSANSIGKNKYNVLFTETKLSKRSLYKMFNCFY